MKKIVLYIIAFAPLITLYSCGGSNAEELERINQLEIELESNEKNLNLDAPMLNERVEYIEVVLSTFKTQYKEEVSKELGDVLSKLNVLRKIYKRNVGSYNESLTEQKELKIQLQNLRKDLITKAISKEEFKEYYKTEKSDIESLLAKSKEVNTAIYELEPEYTRIQTYLEPYLAQIEKDNTK